MSIVEKAVKKHRKDGKKSTGPGGSESVELQKNNGEAKQVPTLLPAEESLETGDGGALGMLVSDDEMDAIHLRKRKVLHLDFEALRDASIVPAADLAPNLADEFRRIKRPLIANAFGKGVVPVENGNLLMLSSAFSGEGKTFTAVNLAMSLALERERTVLLVDADVAKPHISRALGIDQQPGLMDLLMDSTLDIADVMVQTDMPGLRILPAGSRHQYSTEYLASDKMQALVDELSGRYPNRIIIFDSPPLLQTSEAQVLGGLVGQVVLVIHAGSTPQAAVDCALELIDSTKAINLILNKCRVKSVNDYYGGYYAKEYK
ncbi:MAG: AAA family ATPase [Gammaproteobacteria bacterium]|nr:AAA family ATPase [Gammaproteobacteria bacterium]